MNGTGSIKRFI